MGRMPSKQRSVAYFSMEIGIDEKVSTYSGGLGILAGDTIRSAADLKVPMVAVTLLYRKGYFRQELETDGWQREESAAWVVEDFLEEMPHRISVLVEGRTVHLWSWKYEVKGIDGATVPVYFLDAALLTLELLDEAAHRAGRESLIQEDMDAVRKQCVFTTHTPVPAGHDKFPVDLARKVIGAREDFFALDGVLHEGNTLNMTYLALNLSRHIDGVARKHGDISRLMFAGYTIDAITNGVHAATWVSAPFRELFDRYIPLWKTDNFSLRYALSIPREQVWNAHAQNKKRLIDSVNR